MELNFSRFFAAKCINILNLDNLWNIFNNVYNSINLINFNTVDNLLLEKFGKPLIYLF